MSDKFFKVNIYSPEKLLAEYSASLLVCPATDGEIGVMADHMPMICALKKGVCRITTDNGVEKTEIPDGFLSVHDNIADIICK